MSFELDVVLPNGDLAKQQREESEEAVRTKAFVRYLARELRDAVSFPSSVGGFETCSFRPHSRYRPFRDLPYQSHVTTKARADVMAEMAYFFSVLDDLVAKSTCCPTFWSDT